MPLPLVLSPYLRPLVQDGAVAYDNGVTGTVHHFTAVQDQVVRALWSPPTALAALDTLLAQHGEGPVGDAIADLAVAGVVYESRDAADEALEAVLESGCPPVPFIDQIELTNVCPMTCGFCPRGIPDRMQRPVGRMSLDTFQRILDQLHPNQHRYRPLELHHLGESLTHPEVDRFIAAASERALPTELSVNPALLSPSLGRRIVDAGVRRIIVSLDGMDDETLVAIRGPAAKYSKSEPNLDALLDYIAGADDPPVVVIQMIDLVRNREQRSQFLDRWTRNDLPTVHTYIKDLDGPDPDTGTTSATPVTHLCSYPWRSVVVLWDGRVVPCCRDDDAHLVLGDLNHQSMQDIWNGPVARALREQHSAGCIAAGHLCHECPWSRERFAGAMPTRHPADAVASPLHW